MNKLCKITLALGTSLFLTSAFAADNLLQNPGFETQDSWTITGNAVAIQGDRDNLKSGSSCLKFWSSDPVEFEVTQQVTLNAGSYTFGGFLEGGDAGDGAVFQLIADVNGTESKADTGVSGWKKWAEPKVENFEVPADNTAVTLKIKVKAAAKAWGAFDDMYLYKN